MRHIGVKGLLVFVEIVGQRLRDGRAVELGGVRSIVAWHVHHAYLVFHLYHHYGLFLVVVAQVFHYLAERLLVGFKHVVAQRAGLFHGFAFVCHGSRESFCVAFKPFRSIAAHGVFPCAKP